MSIQKEIFDVLATRCYGTTAIAPSTARMVGKFAKQIAADGVTPAELDRLCDVYRKAWPTCTMTPAALAKHIDTLRAMAKDTPKDADDKLMEWLRNGEGW